MVTVGNKVGFWSLPKIRPRIFLMERVTGRPVFGLGRRQNSSSGMEIVCFDQGAFGHERKKPTACMTNLPDMTELDGCRSGEKGRWLASSLEERLQQTASWSIWAPGLRAP